VEPPSPSSRQQPRHREPILRIGVLVLVIAVALTIAQMRGWLDYQHALEHVARLRRSHSFPVFTVVFVVASGVGMALGLPGMPFVVAAGALFGTLLGSLLGWAASMLGAVVGYWVARTIGRDVVLRWMRRFKRLDAAISEGGDFVALLWLRLLPVLPIGVVNFIAGLARAPFLVYLVSTAIGIVPATVIYAYFADSLLEGVGNGRREAIRSLVIASALLIALSLAPFVTRRWRPRASRARAGGRVASHAHPSRRP
jgi:uncharacterized membrane protein YdjX (TVP38/TMEM64 family)